MGHGLTVFEPAGRGATRNLGPPEHATHLEGSTPLLAPMRGGDNRTTGVNVRTRNK